MSSNKVVFPIFSLAKRIIDDADFTFHFVRDDSSKAVLIVKGVPIHITCSERGIKFNCGCEAHMKRMAQNKLCKRIIAAVMILKCYGDRFFEPVHIAEGYLERYGVRVIGRGIFSPCIKLQVKDQVRVLDRVPSGTAIFASDARNLEEYLGPHSLACIMKVYAARGIFTEKYINKNSKKLL